MTEAQKEHKREYKRQWNKAHPMTEAQKEAKRLYKRKWAEDNPEKIRKYRETSAAKKKAESGIEGSG